MSIRGLIQVVFFLVLCTVRVAGTKEVRAVKASATVRLSELSISSKPVKDWSVEDVEYWMNHTIGYTEYSGFVRKHLIDGPTLLGMDPEDFEEHFPIENTLHVIKLGAHLRLIKGFCLCDITEDVVHDFWSYMRRENFRVWVIGITALFFPRFSMLYVLFFDNTLYELLLGVPLSQSASLTSAASDSIATSTCTVPFLHVCFFLVSMTVSPNLFMAVEIARLVTTNFLVIPFLLYFVIQGYHEYLLFYFVYKGLAFPPDTSFLMKVWMVCSYTVFIPVITFLLYFITPYSFQVLGIYIVLLYCVIITVLFVLTFLTGFIHEEGDNKEKNE